MVIRAALVATALGLSAAGCSTGTAAAPSSSTSTTLFSRTQVLGWITPTLGNGIALAHSVPSTAPVAQLSTASGPLRTAASVSLHDLTQVPWVGRTARPEKALVKALERFEAVTATEGASFVTDRADAIASVEASLRALTTSVEG